MLGNHALSVALAASKQLVPAMGYGGYACSQCSTSTITSHHPHVHRPLPEQAGNASLAIFPSLQLDSTEVYMPGPIVIPQVHPGTFAAMKLFHTLSQYVWLYHRHQGTAVSDELSLLDAKFHTDLAPHVASTSQVAAAIAHATPSLQPSLAAIFPSEGSHLNGFCLREDKPAGNATLHLPSSLTGAPGLGQRLTCHGNISIPWLDEGLCVGTCHIAAC